MSLQLRLTALAQAIGADIKALNASVAALQPSSSWTNLTVNGGGSAPTGFNIPAIRLDSSDVVRFRGVWAGATLVGGTVVNGVFTPPATPLLTLTSGFRPAKRRVIQGIGGSAMADLVAVIETNGQLWLTGNLDPSVFISFDGATYFLK